MGTIVNDTVLYTLKLLRKEILNIPFEWGGTVACEAMHVLSCEACVN